MRWSTRAQSAEERPAGAARCGRRHRRHRLPHRRGLGAQGRRDRARHQRLDAGGRPRTGPKSAGSPTTSTFVEAQRRRAALRGRVASTPTRSPSASATCRDIDDGAEGSLPRAASAAAGCCAWNFPRSTMPLLDRSTSNGRSTRFRASARRSPATASPIGTWSNRSAKFPNQGNFAGDDPRRRLSIA